MLKVLSTKLLDEDLVETAHDMGISLICEEFIRIHELNFDVSVLKSLKYDAIVFTSSNAVNSFYGNENVDRPNHTIPVYAVSGKTKDELENYDIVPVAIADNANDLADKILADKRIRSVLHICGSLRLDVLENKLTASGVSYTPLTVCETILNSTILDDTYDVVMFFSPSGIDSFIMKNQLSHDTLYCCIGETTAERLKSINDKLTVIVPVQPTPEAMLKVIKNFKKQMI